MRVRVCVCAQDIRITRAFVVVRSVYGRLGRRRGFAQNYDRVLRSREMHNDIQLK